ncbi:protein moonraker [Petaurus breviceps papuanus]|uniref:protein moonraker n=1 Tax=Petaurus breviceps papuanus TaxID=3040969 RepID=UPI0036DF3FBD
MGPSNLPTQLQFNRNVPSLPHNLAARYSGPRPIVIEKLKAPEQAAAASAPPRCASVPFRVVSEEKLRLAVRLARRDVKRGQLGELGRAQEARGALPAPAPLLAPAPLPAPGRAPGCGPRKPPAPQPAQPPGVRELLRLQGELSACLQRIGDLAAPAADRPEDPGPEEAGRGRVRRQEQAVRSARTLYALRQQVKEIQEELDNLSPHRIRHTKKSRAMSRLAAAHRGAIRALRMFVSQFADSKEEVVSERCRELGTLIRQLSICSARLDADPSVPIVVLDLLQQIEELDSLLERKQSLGKIKKCFPAVGSQSPLGFPMALERSFSTSPVRERKPLVAKERLPQERRRATVRKLLAGEGTSLPLTPLCQMLGEGLKGQPEEGLASSHRNAFKIGLASTKAEAVRKRPLPAARPLRRRSVETAAKSEQGFHKVERLRPHQAQSKDHRFQRMTASFRLKKNQPPVKDRRMPWIPPNPTSPKASPKCVAWEKGSASPQDAKREPSLQREAIQEEGACADPIEHEALRWALTAPLCAWYPGLPTAYPPSPKGQASHTPLLCRELTRHCPQTRVGGSQSQRRGERRNCLQTPQAPSLQTRLAWLDAESTRRLKELDELKARELADIQRLSASTSELVDKVGKAVLERLKPLLEQVEAPPRKELPDSTPHDSAPDLGGGTCTRVSQPEAMGFQDEDSPDLWIMMRRMEEMERYQEAVRQRFSLVYADLNFGTSRGRSNREGPAVDERPRPPHPIQLTKKAASAEPKVSILLGNPLDEKCFDESMDTEEREEKRAPLGPVSSAAPQQPEGSILLSVPRDMLQNLSNYQDSYQEYLRTISHESIGTFNPWIIVESLAEELVEEALEDVAAELQDVCEDYAEAVFTSEFLEPSK